MSYELNLDLGLKTFKVKFAEFDDTVDILFNPADADLPKRLFEAQKMIEQKSNGIKDFELDENGMPKTDSYIDNMNEINNSVFEAIDYAFGNKIADKIFKYCSPFTITNGQYFIIQFFEKIAPALEEIIKKERKNASEQANKHLAKYVKQYKK